MLRYFFAPGQEWSSLSYFPGIEPYACHALKGAVFYRSKMRVHVAADARVTSGALYLQGPRRVFRGLGLGFQGLESKQPRSGSSATPYTYPEARHAKNKNKIRIVQVSYPHDVILFGISQEQQNTATTFNRCRQQPPILRRIFRKRPWQSARHICT